MSTGQDFEQLRESIEVSQRRTTFPDTLRAGRSVDSLLWHGDPKAPLVQRIGLAIFAVMFLGPAAGFVFF
jgi:hypothetical protein